MHVEFESTIERRDSQGRPYDVPVVVEGTYDPGTPPSRRGHIDHWDDGEPGEAIITRVRLAGTEGGCVIATLTEEDHERLEDHLHQAGAEAARGAAEDAEASAADLLEVAS